MDQFIPRKIHNKQLNFFNSHLLIILQQFNKKKKNPSSFFLLVCNSYNTQWQWGFGRPRKESIEDNGGIFKILLSLVFTWVALNTAVRFEHPRIYGLISAKRMCQSTVDPARDEKERESQSSFIRPRGITKNIRGRLIATNDNASERYYDAPRELVKSVVEASNIHTHIHRVPSYCLTRSYLASETTPTSLDASR